jgi:hypothetical protein
MRVVRVSESILWVQPDRVLEKSCRDPGVGGKCGSQVRQRAQAEIIGVQVSGMLSPRAFDL